MEKQQVLGSPLNVTVPSENDNKNTNSEHKCTTPPPPRTPQSQESCRISPVPGGKLRRPGTPDRLKVPKAFKYPERYRSPTDLMVSPVTKGLLARSRKGGVVVLPPSSKDQLKVPDLRVQDAGLFH